MAGGFLIHENKSTVEASAKSMAEIKRRIHALRGASDPFAYVSEELELVEETLSRAIRSREQGLTEIAAHLINGGGKRVRPAVTILAFLAFGGQRAGDIIDIATALELI